MSRWTGVEKPGVSLAREISMSRSAFSAGFKELVAVCKRRSREVLSAVPKESVHAAGAGGDQSHRFAVELGGGSWEILQRNLGASWYCG